MAFPARSSGMISAAFSSCFDLQCQRSFVHGIFQGQGGRPAPVETKEKLLLTDDRWERAMGGRGLLSCSLIPFCALLVYFLRLPTSPTAGFKSRGQGSRT
jgi:hypothetical protein